MGVPLWIIPIIAVAVLAIFFTLCLLRARLHRRYHARLLRAHRATYPPSLPASRRPSTASAPPSSTAYTSSGPALTPSTVSPHSNPDITLNSKSVSPNHVAKTSPHTASSSASATPSPHQSSPHSLDSATTLSPSTDNDQDTSISPSSKTEHDSCDCGRTGRRRWSDWRVLGRGSSHGGSHEKCRSQHHSTDPSVVEKGWHSEKQTGATLRTIDENRVQTSLPTPTSPNH